ncbi:MAG: hypothetical protein WBQ14_02735 [Gaiellaceae bacterium]
MSGEMSPRNPNRGAGLLLEHFAAFDEMSLRQREPARVRLQRALGPDLSRLLLRALARESEAPSHTAASGPAA